MKYIIGILTMLFLMNCNQTNSTAKIDENHSSINIKKEVNENSESEKSVANIIIIQPFEGISENQVNYIFTELKKVIPQVVLNEARPLPSRAYYKPRNRYRADTIIYIMRGITKVGHVTIGLTNKDISSDKGNIVDYGIMGLGYQPGKACVVSTFRLSKKKINEQFFKVALHELGHTQGLPHCADVLCLMTDAKGKNKTDKEKGFCDKCKLFLINKGWKL
jgi:archaemetzincin